MTQFDVTDDPSPPHRQQSFEAYLSWLQVLETAASTSAIGVLSRQYSDEWMDSYTRSSRLCSGARGAQAICFANLEVNKSKRGRKYVSELIAYLEANAGRLQATHFYFENVVNDRFEHWLEGHGFRRANTPGQRLPCFLREICNSGLAK